MDRLRRPRGIARRLPQREDRQRQRRQCTSDMCAHWAASRLTIVVEARPVARREEATGALLPIGGTNNFNLASGTCSVKKAIAPLVAPFLATPHQRSPSCDGSGS